MNTNFFDLLNRAHELKLVIDGTTIRLNVAGTSLPESFAGAGDVTANIFRLVQGRWHIRFNGHAIARKTAVALTYIHKLLEMPHRYMAAPDLVAAHCGGSPTVTPEKALLAEGYRELGISKQSQLGEPILDDEARRRLLVSLRELKDELKDLEGDGENTLALEKQQEIENVEDYLRKAGFGSHTTRFNGRADRDRKSVSVAIARAITDITKDHPALARHLDNSIRTGMECGYAPETEVKWLL